MTNYIILMSKNICIFMQNNGLVQIGRISKKIASDFTG